MKALWTLFLAGALLAACGDDAAEEGITLELKSNKDKQSYAVGSSYAEQLTQDPNFDQYDQAQLIAGFEEGLKDENAFGMDCQNQLAMTFGQGMVDPGQAKAASDCIGRLLGTQFVIQWEQENFISKFDLEIVKKAFELGLNGGDTLLPVNDRDMLVQRLMADKNKRIFTKADRAEAVFFDKVKKINAIRDIGNGLYLEPLKEGTGGSPVMGDDIKVQYVLTLPAGDTIESSLEAAKAGQPIPAFNLGEMIPGWQMAFPKMKKGGKYRLYVPQSLGYGGNVRPGSPIPAFSPLIFYIELQDFGPAGTLRKQAPMGGM